MIVRQNPRELVDGTHPTPQFLGFHAHRPGFDHFHGEFHEFVGGAEGVVERGAALALHVPQKRDVLVIGVRGAQLRGRPALQLRLPAQLRGASRKNTAEFEDYCVLSAMHPTLTR